VELGIEIPFDCDTGSDLRIDTSAEGGFTLLAVSASTIGNVEWHNNSIALLK
jgi:hypothetical protein